MDEELLPTSTMPVGIGSANFPTPTTCIYPNLQQEIVQDLSVGCEEEVNTGSQQLRMSPSINAHTPVVAASSSRTATTTTGNNNSYLSTSVNYSSGGNVTFHSSPAHRSKTNRKKSRKLTLTQVCSDGSPSKTGEQHKSNPMDADRMSNYNSSLIGFESDNSTTTSSSSLKSGPERKINRIFSMLQSMQQTFLQNNPPQQPPPQPPQQQPPPTPTSSHHHHQGKLPKEPIYEQPHHSSSNNRSSDSLESGTDTIHSDDGRGQRMRMQLQTSSSAPSRQLLYGLGRSQDSLMSTARMSAAANKTNFMAVNNSSNVNNKGPIYASWNGSQYSTNTYTTMTSDGAAAPPMTHAMPYHKDGWYLILI